MTVLDLVHHLIALAEDAVDVIFRAAAAAQADTDACSEAVLAEGVPYCGLQHPALLLQHRLGAAFVDRSELVAAQSVAGCPREELPDKLGCLNKNLVAGGVTEGIVHLLEAVEIHIDQRKGVLFYLVKADVEIPPVVKAGKHIGIGGFVSGLFAGTLDRHVVHHDIIAGDVIKVISYLQLTDKKALLLAVDIGDILHVIGVTVERILQLLGDSKISLLPLPVIKAFPGALAGKPGQGGKAPVHDYHRSVSREYGYRHRDILHQYGQLYAHISEIRDIASNADGAEHISVLIVKRCTAGGELLHALVDAHGFIADDCFAGGHCLLLGSQKGGFIGIAVAGKLPDVVMVSANDLAVIFMQDLAEAVVDKGMYPVRPLEPHRVGKAVYHGAQCVFVKILIGRISDIDYRSAVSFIQQPLTVGGVPDVIEPFHQLAALVGLSDVDNIEPLSHHIGLSVGDIIRQQQACHTVGQRQVVDIWGTGENDPFRQVFHRDPCYELEVGNIIDHQQS